METHWDMKEKAHRVQDLDVYRGAFELQQAIFQVSIRWPAEERYALIDQVRRSARAIGANLAEAWSKRAYRAQFRCKLTDADGELQETIHWLSTAAACRYLDDETSTTLLTKARLLGRQLGAMLMHSDSFCLRTD